MSQSEALETYVNHDSPVIPFTVLYNPSLPNIGKTITRYWDLLKLSKGTNLKHVHETYKPIVAYKRPKNLHDYLVRSAFVGHNENTPTSSTCGRRRCSHCVSINTGNQFSSHVTGDNFYLRQSTNCKTENVIYLISCKKCNLQYVGQTSQPVSRRMNSHRFDICNFEDPLFSSTVATHFNSDHHSICDFSFMPIDVVPNNFNRSASARKLTGYTNYELCIQKALILNCSSKSKSFIA